MNMIHSRILWALIIAFLSGCASLESRKNLENVAKQWCETIRASQIICAYPLTEDLVPGDVYLVQTTIQEQSDLYRKRGFLSLDDHQTRLKTDYKLNYFDAYWKDAYGETPHQKPKLSASSPQAVDAPRAAFPSYTFEASSTGGISLALPINGIPIGLGFLKADQAAGNIVLSNAYTYAADTGALYDALQSWAERNKAKLAMILNQSRMDVMFLRVVSRVYLVGGVNVTLTRSASSGGQAAINGGAPSEPASAPVPAFADANDMLTKLNAQAIGMKSALPGSGEIRFLSASSSGVTLAETFDRPLVVGYLGFDVPVSKGGTLGAPIPVFERLEGRLAENGYPVNMVSPDIAAYKLQKFAFQSLAAKYPSQALNVARYVSEQLDSSEFRDGLQCIAKAERGQGQVLK